MEIGGRRFGLVVFGVLALGMLLAEPSGAGTLYNNLSPGNTFLINQDFETNLAFMATTFVTTGQGNLGDVLTPVFSLDSPVTFGIYTDSVHAPGALLESWTVSVPGFPAVLMTLPSVQRPILSAATPYWFVITLDAAQRNNVAWYQNNEGVTGGVRAGDTLNAMLEFVPGSPAPAIQLNSAAAAPEPAGCILLGCGLYALALFCRRRGGSLSYQSQPGRNAILLMCLAYTLNGQALPNLFPFPNASGLLETGNAGNRSIDLSGAFFESLGSNGRSCGSCHRPAQGWSISAAEVALRFVITQGLDPIFRPNDGSNCDHNIDTSTVTGRRNAYSLLVERGLIRIALQPPPTAEFDVVSVANPYGCNDRQTLSMYRRPLPTTNLRFLSTLMWDGRESSTQTGTQKITTTTNPGDLLFDLAHQAIDATNTHAQAATPPSAQKQQDIVNFEMNLITAQAFDYRAGFLNADGATGGPNAIAANTVPAFYVGINDPLGGNPLGTPFTPVIFRLFDAWAQSSGGVEREDPRSARARIARGQVVFNSKPIAITGVGGLNDDLNITSIPGTCGTCHDSPNIGNHSVSAPLNIGVGDVTSPLNVAYLPVITLENKTTHESKRTTDPGRALITGLWKDVGRMKGPILRGLASRAPYFHNGSAGSLSDVLDFYEKRFNIGLTAQERADLIAFLNSL